MGKLRKCVSGKIAKLLKKIPTLSVTLVCYVKNIYLLYLL